MPTLELTPKWGIEQTMRVPAQTIALGDGYNVLMPIGIRAFDEVWAVQSPAMHYGKALQAKAELEQFTGTEPFEWRTDPSVPYKEFICSGWQISAAGPGYYRIGGTFEALEQASLVVSSVFTEIPIVPVTFTWNTQHDYVARTQLNRTRYNDGVDRRARYMINPVNEQFNATVIVKNYTALQDFLIERRGRPFRLRPENRHLDAPDHLYICKEWTWQKPGYGIAWRFSADFEQVRTLKDAPA